eukprot:scaffold870_cov268-Pinguiococcus_pyrenoidosus.AAC.64
MECNCGSMRQLEGVWRLTAFSLALPSCRLFSREALPFPRHAGGCEENEEEVLLLGRVHAAPGGQGTAWDLPVPFILPPNLPLSTRARNEDLTFCRLFLLPVFEEAESSQYREAQGGRPGEQRAFLHL